MKRVLLIGNPAAGRGKARENIELIVLLLKRRGLKVEVFLTYAPGDGESRAAEVGLRNDLIVIAGGDGTVNEVVNGLPDPSLTPLLLMPSGTANMLALELGIPRDPEGVASILDDPTIRRLDMGIAGGRRFLLVSSAGFDASVTREIKKVRGEKLGYRGYVVPILKGLCIGPHFVLDVDVDGKRTRGSLVMVLNTRNYGGLLEFADSIKPDSGKFDVIVFEDDSAASLIKYSVAALVRKFSSLADAKHLSGKKITICSNQPVPVQIDGDYLGTTPVTIELVPHTIPMMVPTENFQ